MYNFTDEFWNEVRNRIDYLTSASNGLNELDDIEVEELVILRLLLKITVRKSNCMENYHFILTSLLKIRQSELTSDPQYRQNLSKHQFRELQLITELLNFYKNDSTSLQMPSDLDCLIYVLQQKLMTDPENMPLDEGKLLNLLETTKSLLLKSK